MYHDKSPDCARAIYRSNNLSAFVYSALFHEADWWSPTSTSWGRSSTLRYRWFSVYKYSAAATCRSTVCSSSWNTTPWPGSISYPFNTFHLISRQNHCWSSQEVSLTGSTKHSCNVLSKTFTIFFFFNFFCVFFLSIFSNRVREIYDNTPSSPDDSQVQSYYSAMGNFLGTLRRSQDEIRTSIG